MASNKETIDVNNRTNHPNASNVSNNGPSNRATTSSDANITLSHQQQNPPADFALRHGSNYRGPAAQPAAHVSSAPQANATVPTNTAPTNQIPPMENRNIGARHTVFSANSHLMTQMPAQPFYVPPLGMLQVNAQFNNDDNQVERNFTDIRTVYLERLREMLQSLATDGIAEAELKTMLDRAINYDTRITKFVEQKEDTNRLPPNELQANQAMLVESNSLVVRIKTDISMKLTYYQAGTQPSAHEHHRITHLRRLQAKIEPFGGALEQWPNFKSKWQEYYHNCGDMTDIELFMKLDEFIMPNSEAYALIQSFDRAINGSYQDAWAELCARYDNPRLQVDSIIMKMTGMDKITNCRDDYLRTYTIISNVIHSLPRMNVDVTGWDPILVHLLERKMDGQSFNEWNEVRTPRDIPQLQEFIDFLIEKIDRGDSSAHTNQRDHPRDHSRQQHREQQSNRSSSYQGSQRNGNGPNAHRQQQAGSSQAPNNSRSRPNDNAGAAGGAPTRIKSAIQKVIKCAICNIESHKSYQCPTFLKLDLQGRSKKVRERRLCENCLRPNCNPNRCTLRSCTNTGCDAKHNRLICPLTFAPTVNHAQPAESSQM